jgi:hypothetical protein
MVGHGSQQVGANVQGLRIAKSSPTRMETTKVPINDQRAAFDRSMQHHLESDLFKGGVYDPRGAIETFSRGQAGHLAPIEVRAVIG